MPMPKKKKNIVLFNKNSKTAIIKMFQQVRANVLEQKDTKSHQRNKRGKGSNGHFRTEKYSK